MKEVSVLKKSIPKGRKRTKLGRKVPRRKPRIRKH